MKLNFKISIRTLFNKFLIVGSEPTLIENLVKKPSFV